jgi:hypothetical protein
MYEARMPYFLVPIQGDADRAVGLLAQVGIQVLISFDSMFARTVSARLHAESPEKAAERVRVSLEGEELTVGEAVPEDGP